VKRRPAPRRSPRSIRLTVGRLTPAARATSSCVAFGFKRRASSLDVWRADQARAADSLRPPGRPSVRCPRFLPAAIPWQNSSRCRAPPARAFPKSVRSGLPQLYAGQSLAIGRNLLERDAGYAAQAPAPTRSSTILKRSQMNRGSARLRAADWQCRLPAAARRSALPRPRDR